MNCDGWTEEAIDPSRMGRLGVSYLVGAAILGGVVGWLSLTGADVTKVSAEETLDVTFAELPEPEEEPEPEVVEPEPEAVEPPPPPPTPMAAVPIPDEPPPAPGAEAPEVPDAVPDRAPEQREPVARTDRHPYADGFGHGGRPGGHGVGSGAVATPPPAPPPPPPPPASPGARRSLMATLPAVRLSCPQPAPPSSAVGEGGLVMVKLKVDASGAVVRVKAASGPAALRPFAEQAAMGCRFRPAQDKDTGEAVPFLLVLPFQFTAKT